MDTHHVCGQDIVKTHAVLRAQQLGLVSAAAVAHATDNRGAGIDVDALVAAVRERLPNFAPSNAAA